MNNIPILTCWTHYVLQAPSLSLDLVPKSTFLCAQLWDMRLVWKPSPWLACLCRLATDKSSFSPRSPAEGGRWPLLGGTLGMVPQLLTGWFGEEGRLELETRGGARDPVMLSPRGLPLT